MRGFANSDELYPFYVQIRLEKTSPTETYKLWDVPFFHFNVVLLDLFILTNTSALLGYVLSLWNVYSVYKHK